MNDTILVTGAAGFVGKHLVPRLTDEGHDVVAVDIAPQPPDYDDFSDGRIEYLRGDVLDSEFMDDVFELGEYDHVFHLAAVVGVDNYVGGTNPIDAVDVNVNGTRNILERLADSDTHLVYTSTSEVYGYNPDLPWSETDERVVGPPTSPRWSYSVSKALCEHMIHGVGDADSPLTATVVRPFNLYGPRQRGGFVIPKFVQRVLDGRPPKVYGDGTQRRCFTYVDDFIEGLVAASERETSSSEAYNLGGTEEIEIRTLAEKILELAEVDDSPEFVKRDEVHGEDFEDPDRRIPDISKARRELDWEPTTELEDGLAETLAWFREQK
jgi:UDP-glucose 4-epimerase